MFDLYQFIQAGEKGPRARIQPLVLNFIDEIQGVEREGALSH